MNVEHHSEMTCPGSDFTGDFKRAVPGVWVADPWHWLVERNHARRIFGVPRIRYLSNFRRRSLDASYCHAADFLRWGYRCNRSEDGLQLSCFLR
jgi:hypothetical protein